MFLSIVEKFGLPARDKELGSTEREAGFKKGFITSSSSVYRSASKNCGGGFDFVGYLVEEVVSSVLLREYGPPSRDWRPLKFTTGVSAAVGLLKMGKEGFS